MLVVKELEGVHAGSAGTFHRHKAAVIQDEIKHEYRVWGKLPAVERLKPAQP